MGEDTKIPEAVDFRKRIMREDDLLNSRTTLFLVTSGLLLTAVGLSTNPFIGLLLTVLGILVTIAWSICSWQNWKVIKHLTIEYRECHKENYIENIVHGAMFKPGWKRPTDLIAKPLPYVFLVTWIVLLTINIIVCVVD